MTNQSIWKYPLQITDEQLIEMPTGAVPLAVKMQGGKGPMLWAQVDVDATKEKRRVRIFGTGHPLPNNTALGLQYVGTVLTAQDLLVWHVFISA